MAGTAAAAAPEANPGADAGREGRGDAVAVLVVVRCEHMIAMMRVRARRRDVEFGLV
jgi:hypothetical protein